MNDRRLDAETAERMLRGEATGPPELAAVLAAAASGLAADDPKGEEAAVAAFRAASLARPPRARRLSALLSLKAGLIALLLAITGGVAVAATTRHLPGPLGPRHPDGGRTPATSRTYGAPSAPHASPQGSPYGSPHAPSPAPSSPVPDQTDPKATHPGTPHHTEHSQTKGPKKPKKTKIAHLKASVPAHTPSPVDGTPGLMPPAG